MLTVEEGIGQELCASSLDLILGGQQSVILLFISGSNEQETKEPSEERRRLLILWAGSLMDGHVFE